MRRRFLARHPEAAFYADFPDFGFWRLEVEGAHYIGGFGRIFDLDPGELLVPLDGAEDLVEAEPGIVEHMNEDHADAIELYATALADAGAGPWRMTGIDPEGFDLSAEGRLEAHPVRRPVATPAEARNELVRLAAEARAASRIARRLNSDRLALKAARKSVLGRGGHSTHQVHIRGSHPHERTAEDCA